jgi:hypothetical protein
MLRTILLIAGFLAMPQWTVPLHVPVVAAAGVPCTSLPFSDNFTRANGPLVGPYSQTSGATWAISSNSLTTGAYTGEIAAWLSGCSGFGTSQYARVTVTTMGASGHFGLVLYATDQNNFYYVDCTPTGGCSAIDRVSGTDNYIGSFTQQPVPGDVVCLQIASGTSVNMKVNSTLDTPKTVSALSSGVPGLWTNALATPSVYNSFSAGNGTCP